MKNDTIGADYVGLVAGAYITDFEHDVTAMDRYPNNTETHPSGPTSIFTSPGNIYPAVFGVAELTCWGIRQ